MSGINWIWGRSYKNAFVLTNANTPGTACHMTLLFSLFLLPIDLASWINKHPALQLCTRRIVSRNEGTAERTEPPPSTDAACKTGTAAAFSRLPLLSPGAGGARSNMHVLV